MLVAYLRTDIPRLLLDDVEDTSRRNFSSEPKGQSRYLRRPTDAQLEVVLNKWALLSEQGSDTNANVDTSVNDTLRIREDASASYTVIAVTSGAATAKTTIRDDLNAAFAANGLNFTASITGTNQIQIDTVAPNSGPSALLDIDTIANGSTLSTPLGFTDGVTLTGLSVAALITAIYPTATTVDVSSATIVALSTFSLLTQAQQDLLVFGDDNNGIQDTVASRLVETAPVLLSFANGVLSQLFDANFQPGGDRIGLTVGPAVAIVEDDGSTIFTV